MTATVAPAAPAAPVTPAAPAAPANGAPKGAPETPATDTKVNAAPAAPEQPWKVKRKLKLDGKEIEREYDDRRLQILEHEYSKRGEAQKQQDAFNERLRKLNEDPDSLFAEAGFDVDGYLEARAARAEQMKKLSPDALRAQQAEEKLARMEQQATQRAEAERVASEQREHDEFVQTNVARLGKAIELSGLPRSGELVRLYSEVQEMAHHAGEPEMSPEQVVAAGERLMAKRMSTLLKSAGNEGWRTRNQAALQELAKAVLPALEGEALLNWVGKDNALRVVKALHAKTRTSPVPIVQEPTPTAPAAPAPNGQPARTEWDILDALGG